MSEAGVPRRVSLILVAYRGKDVIADCVHSAQAGASHAGLELEVIVVDNGQGDGTVAAVLEAAPDTTTIDPGGNVGFARACNLGFEAATGQWWFLLNPDARIDEGSLAELVSFAASHPKAGAVAPVMTGGGTGRAESGGMQPGLRSAAGHFLLINRLLPGDRGGPWRGLQVQRRADLGPRRLEWASGGAILLRPAAVREVGLFDPTFFLYAEDVDLGRRMMLAGWETWLVPEAHVHHPIAASQGGVTERWYVALHDYYARSAPRWSVVMFDLAAALGMSLRMIGARGDELHRRRMRVAARAALRLALGRTA